MKKKDIIKRLEPFDDEDEISFNGDPHIFEIQQICGRGQYGMIYKCSLPKNHEGQCYCSCKGVEFDPD